MNYTIEDAMDNEEPMTQQQAIKAIKSHNLDMVEFFQYCGLETDYTADVVYGWLGD